MKDRVDKWLVTGGLSLLVLQALIIASTPLEYGYIVVATLFILAGLLGVGNRLRTERRVYLQLRSEVDDFIALVRAINAQTVAGEGKQIAETKAAMHESVERIAQASGVLADAKD